MMAVYRRYILELVEAVQYAPGRELEDGKKCFTGTCRRSREDCSGCISRMPYLKNSDGVEQAILDGDYIVFNGSKKELRRKQEFERDYKMVEGSDHVDY